MPRRFMLLNAALAVVALLSIGYMVNELRTPAPVVARRPPPATAPAATTPPPAPEPPSSFSVVATRNLFSPTRTEAPVTPPTQTAAGPPMPKPNLYGIILRDGAPVAYLEDPASKRVGGYRVGDAVAGGTVKRIGADHVVLNRPEGDVSVRLRDPSKPRPAVPVAGPTPPPVAGAPTGPVVPGAPGVPPTVASPQVPQPGQGITRPPLPSPVLPRRPLPPNLLRRLPPSATDAPAQQ
jgi:hypothetical protein